MAVKNVIRWRILGLKLTPDTLPGGSRSYRSPEVLWTLKRVSFPFSRSGIPPARGVTLRGMSVTVIIGDTPLRQRTDNDNGRHPMATSEKLTCVSYTTNNTVGHRPCVAWSVTRRGMDMIPPPRSSRKHRDK